jgi:hypothetical protein
MINPKFPFDGKQIILTSERVMLHAKNDGIFLFGKNMVSLSSTQTINLDCNEKILLDCDKIELGHRAETLGQPILLGRVFIDNFLLLLNSLQEAASLMQSVAETDPAGSFMNIQSAGNTIYSSVSRLSNILETEDNPQNPLSKVTFSR